MIKTELVVVDTITANCLLPAEQVTTTASPTLGFTVLSVVVSIWIVSPGELKALIEEY